MPTVPRSNRVIGGGPELNGFDEQGGYAAKIKIRYLVEKRIDDEWVVMARLSAETDRMIELCEALGGQIRVEDIETKTHVIDQEFE